MAGVSTVEFDYCRELALLPGSVFEFTSRFLTTEKCEPLLALYALRQAIGTIPDTRADDSVKWAKLKWWSEELVADPGAASRHPVLRALWQSGARARLENPLLLRLIGDALSQIDIVADSDESVMFERHAELGATEIQLELALDDVEIDPQSLNFLGAATSSFHFISSFSANQASKTAQLPLSVLAKHDVTASQLEQKTHQAELVKIIRQLTENTLTWYSKGMSNLNIGPESSVCSHLQLRWAMEKRRLDVIRQDTHRFLATGKRYGPADALFAWRFLRKMR
ncbi:squalene/phytoene synthase family protein [Pseudomonadota bacterium]